MARTPSTQIVAVQSEATIGELRERVARLRRALTRANREFAKDEAAFRKEAKRMQGVLPENFSESYHLLMDRRDRSSNKMFEADEAYWAAREELGAFSIEVAQATAALAERRMESAAVAYASA